MASARDRNVGGARLDVAAQARKIHSWIQNADFGDRDREISRMMENADKYIDPSLPVTQNYQIIKDRLGLKTLSDRKEIARTAKDQAKQSAIDAIRDNLERIEDGQADQLLEDIAEEYGQDFVDETIEIARAETENELGGAPEPNEKHLSSISGEASLGPDKPERPARPDRSGPMIPPADDGRPSPDRTPAPAPAKTGRSFELPAIGQTLISPIKTLLVVIYVLVMIPWDSTDPEVTAA